MEIKPTEIKEQLDYFFEIREHNTGYKYIHEFLTLVIDNNIPVTEYEEFYEAHKDKIGQKYKPQTKMVYNGILKQFIRQLNPTTPKKQEDNLSKKENTQLKPQKKRIYDTFYELQNESKYKVDY